VPGGGFSILSNRQVGKGVNVSELGERDHIFAAKTADILTESVRYVGADVEARILSPGVHRGGKGSQRTDLMEAARNAGRDTVRR
jgi:hypothetical protein